MILTVDLGTSVTKVGVWGDDGLLAMGRAPLRTYRPQLGWAEQHPSDWWQALTAAAAEARAQAPEAFRSVEAIGFAAARQTIVTVAADGRPMGPALLWSDRRAEAESASLIAATGGPEAVHALTGVPMEAGGVAPKLAWLAAHEPERLASCSWLLAPRDLMAWVLTGELATDPSMASCMGIRDLDGQLVGSLARPAEGKLAPIRPSTSIVGQLHADRAEALGVPAGVAVVIGAGDRQCEVVGSGAGADRPMVSWGTTANVSLPVDARPAAPLPGVMLSRSASGGWQHEAGLSAAGSWLEWLGKVTDRRVGQLLDLAAASPPGARGVTAAPWLDGARAPWWDDSARAGLVGIGADHTVADLARAAVEAVGWDVYRCLGLLLQGRAVDGLALAGAGGASPVWTEVITSMAGLTGTRRRSGEAASTGAALLVSEALGLGWRLDRIDPIVEEHEPDLHTVTRYRELRGPVEAVATRLLGP